jgi:hypothetical protein
LAGEARAGLILSGSVAFDPASGLYTYSYVVDNRSGPAAVTEVSILVDSSRQLGPGPLGHTDPSGTRFQLTYSGFSALPPLNEFGRFFAWEIPQGVSVGATLSGFSFTTDRGPTPGGYNNYFVFSRFFPGGPPEHQGVVEYGHIVAPDFGPAGTVVPVPPTLVLAGTGALGLLGCRGRRRSPA